jgi:hypothetical protein
MDALRLESYSKALAEEFRDDADTIAVLDTLVRSERGEYEAKIPEMGTLLGAVRRRRSERLRVEREKQAEAEWQAHLDHWKAHPEERYTWEDLWRDYNASKQQSA